MRISAEVDHPFRVKPITCFARSRSPVSGEADEGLTWGADAHRRRYSSGTSIRSEAVPAERLPMRQVFEAFRLAFDQGRSQREIARALGLAQSTVNDYLRRIRGTGLPWPVP